MTLLLVITWLYGNFPVYSQAIAVQPSIVDGYWSLSADFHDFSLQSVVRLKYDPQSGRINGVTIGPTDGRDGSFSGSLNGERAILATLGPDGPMTVTIQFEPNKFGGVWKGKSSEGSVGGTKIKNWKSSSTYYGQFLNILLSYCETGVFFDAACNGTDPNQLREKYGRRVVAAKDDADFVQLVRQMIGEIKVSHLDFYYDPKNDSLVQKTDLLTWRPINETTGYIRIRSFQPSDASGFKRFVSELNAAAAGLSRSRNLVVDLRRNTGGDISLLFQTLAYFVEKGQPIIYAFARLGVPKKKHAVDQNSDLLATLPKVRSDEDIAYATTSHGAGVIHSVGNDRGFYSRRIVAIVDENCLSSCEILASVLQEKGATVIGQKTAGYALAAINIPMVKNMVIMKKDSGWRAQVPIIDFFTLKGKRIEQNGVVPDIAETDTSSDSIIEKAVKLVEAGS